MPLIRRWNRMPAVYQWATLCAVLLIMLASACVALVAILTANNTAGCVNNILGDRASVTQIDAQAHIEFAQADQAYNRALDALLKTVPNGTPAEQQARFSDFVAAAAAKEKVSDRYVRVLTDDNDYRRAHPLGQC